MGHLLCLFNPTACATTVIAKATLGDLFNSLTSWVLSSVQWFVTAVGSVLTSASDPSTVVNGANQEFDVLARLSAPIMLLGLVVATLHALRHADAGSLWRVFLGVAPASVVAIAVARPVATLILTGVDQLSSAAASTVSAHETTLIASMNNLDPSTPGFGLFVLAAAVVIGAWMRWCELIVRTVVLTLLLVLVPVIAPMSVFPAGRRLGWRLAETFLAIALSKFLIVITLSLGLSELVGSSATEVVTGAVTLLLATASPFVLLRVIPFVEQAALHNLEGLRSRFTRSVASIPTSPAGVALGAAMPSAPVPGPPQRPDDLGLEMWEGTPSTGPSAPTGGTPPPAPVVGTTQARTGHVAYWKDDMGPVVGWHFDE